MAAKPGPSGTGPTFGSLGSTSQEYIVRVPKDRKKKLAMMKFGSGPGIDFSKVGEVSVKMERENNLREYKTANDLELMPKFGAGSEYGREQKEEARRKKYGIILKKYNPEDQPWHLKVGSGKQAKKFRGVREGSITENTAYYIFTQCADGAFEATPVEEWYNFTPVIRYKHLNAEEAEEEFTRRDKTLNYFNIMLKKRVKNEGDKDVDLDDEEKAAKAKAGKSKKKKKNNEFMLTDMDDWADISDDDDDDEDGEGDDDEEKEKKKPKKAKGGAKKKVKNAKQNSDDEAIEESDEGDYDDREVDYISDTSSSDSEADAKEKKYDEKGVAEEDGLKNILNSDEEEEEEENKEEEEEPEEEEKKSEDKPAKEKKGNENSSSSSSDSDSDIDNDKKYNHSALLMQKDKGEKKKPTDRGDGPSNPSAVKAGKRKGDGDAPSAKKVKREHAAYSGGGSDGITEDAIRRYLQRKPMTTKDLLQKFASKKLNLTREQMTQTIAQLLKKINPERSTINKKLYLSLKKPE